MFFLGRVYFEGCVVMKRDEADFSGPEDRIEFEKRMEREGKSETFDSTPLDEPVSWDNKILGFIRDSLVVLCILVGIGIGGYMVYVWWGVIKTMGFLKFSISLVLFFITIPIAPIYVGINGNWEPAIYVGVGLFCVASIFIIAMWFDEQIY
jgi:hypothetical protein